MKNIVLVGFMGTGKTTVAKKLSIKRGMKYISTDELIEKREESPIADIFAKKGEGYFRALETEIVKDVAALKNAVIDAGGGTVINPENTAILKKGGTLISLTATVNKILERTKNNSNRPLLNVDNPKEKIEELLEIRKPFYEKADYSIDTSGMTIEGVVDAIERIMDERTRSG